MNQLAILKKKGSNPNKAQSPLKNLDADMQYRSSAELVNTFKIKREHVANECNNKSKKEHAPIAHKRKNSEDFIQPQGKSNLFGHKLVIQSSSREELSTSHMIAGKRQNKPRLFQSGESIQEKGIKLPMHNFRFQTSSKEGVTSSVHVTGTTLGDERKQVNHTIADVEYMSAPSIHEHNNGLDDLEDQEEIGEDECVIDEEVDINCSTKGISKLKKVRGQTTCKNIHARNLEEREKVTFDKGQAVGPTGKIVSELTNFIGTIGRNPRFINLIYTRCHASKFLIPVEGKKWVMTGLRDAWRRHNLKVKERLFDKNSTIEDMLAKRPDDIPEVQFRQLIEHWKHPTVQRVAKENKEEPSQSEMFIATRTKTGKNSLLGRKAELPNHQNSGETTDDAFRAVFGNEHPGRLRCYGRSVTTNSLKEDEETNKLQQKHANEINSLKEEMNEMREEMRHFFSQLLQNNPGFNVQAIQGVVGSNLVSPVDTSSTQVVRGHNIPHSSGSTHDPVLQKYFVGSLRIFSLSLSFIDVSNCEDGFLILLGCWFDPAQQDHYS
ncbi:hypothetical protein KY289_011423 [Solanum tuberosum]|nr:hypothetical protein KY289_011423 [Solanum tuberosum]